MGEMEVNPKAFRVFGASPRKRTRKPWTGRSNDAGPLKEADSCSARLGKTLFYTVNFQRRPSTERHSMSQINVPAHCDSRSKKSTIGAVKHRVRSCRLPPSPADGVGVVFMSCSSSDACCLDM